MLESFTEEDFALGSFGDHCFPCACDSCGSRWSTGLWDGDYQGELETIIALPDGVYKRPHGIGVLSGSFSGAGGCKYEGRFRAGKFHGKGAATYAHGAQYEGEWRKGRMHGHGMMRFADGRVYVGTFEAGGMCAGGALRYPEGCDDSGIYSGEFKCNWRHGHGTHSYANGDIYTGQWEAMGCAIDNKKKDDMRQGRGTMSYADAGVYDGQWKNDKRHGHGTMRYPDGREECGVWDCGSFLRALIVLPRAEDSEVKTGRLMVILHRLALAMPGTQPGGTTPFMGWTYWPL